MYFLSGQANRGRGNNDDKFHSRKKMGLPRPAAGSYRGWAFHFVQHQSGTVVKRTTYHVGIEDPHGNRIAYLRDFHSVQTATKAAEDWVDERLRKIDRNTAVKPSIGKIESSRQEK